MDNVTNPCSDCPPDACEHQKPVDATSRETSQEPATAPAPGSRRARLEAKMERRLEWAGRASARATERFSRATAIGSFIPFGQPILVGHHSEGRARADLRRIDSNMSKAVEESRLADHHRSRASGIELQLERSVFSDDSDAVEALEARIAERAADVARVKEINAAFRKAKGDTAARLAALVTAGLLTKELALRLAADMTRFTRKQPYPAYKLTNLNSQIRRDKQRIEEVKRRQARTESAREQGGVKVESSGDYCRVTFADKPAREVLVALREAGYCWRGGSWVGPHAKLPAVVTAPR